MSELPSKLMHLLADSEFVVEAWSHENNELVIRVVKDAAEETGWALFTGVSHVSMPPAFTVGALEVFTIEDAPKELFSPALPSLNELGDCDMIYVLFDSFDRRYVVVAEDLTYEVSH